MDAFFVIFNFFIQKKFNAIPTNRLLHDLHHGLFALTQAVTIQFTIETSLKYFCGRHRPDYFSRLQLQLDEMEIINGSLSFPSGHTCASFCTMVFLFLYLGGKLKLFQRGNFLLFVLAAIPIYIAIFIAATRVRDYKHNYSDIVAGSLVGTFAACVGYFLNYPSLSSALCDLPQNHKLYYITLNSSP